MKHDISNIIKQSFNRAITTGVDAKLAASIFELIKTRFEEEPNQFEQWHILDEQIGQNEDKLLLLELVDLRNHFVNAIVANERDKLNKIFDQSLNEGWSAFLKILVEAITNFRFQFCRYMCKISFPIPTEKTKEFENIKKAILYMFHGRWIEAYVHVAYLSRLEVISQKDKIRLLVILAEIQLFYVLDKNKAKNLLEKAASLAPEEVQIISGLGEYWLEKKEYKKATDFFNKAIKINQKFEPSYSNMGLLYERQQNYELAEFWYKKAIKHGPGYATGYVKLYKLYARNTELFDIHEETIFKLMKKAISVHPEYEYTRYTDIALLYQQNKEYAKAHTWYKKAIKLDEKSLDGYINRAFCYKNEGKNKQANTNFKKAIKKASQSDDGYYLAFLYEYLERWQDALYWFEKCLPQMKGVEKFIRSKISLMKWHLKNYAEAEEELFAILKEDSEYSYTENILVSIASDYYKKNDDVNAASRVYDTLLQIIGNPFKPSYHNLNGNMHFYNFDDESALQDYLKAVSLSPDVAIYHSNLGNAYKNLKNLEKAKEEFKKAFELDRKIEGYKEGKYNEASYNKDMALLSNDEGNNYYSLREYKHAIKKYKESIEFNSNDAVVYSNMGGAWELLKAPGNRVEELENAIEAYQQAYNIVDKKSYKKNIERLHKKREFIKSYGEKSSEWSFIVTPIAMEVAANLIPYVEGIHGGDLSEKVTKHSDTLKLQISKKYGVKIPGIRFRGNETDFPDGTYIISLMEAPLFSGNISLDKRFFPGPIEQLTALQIQGIEAINPENGNKGYWIEKKDWNLMEERSYRLWDIMEYPLKHLEYVISKNLVEFVGHQEVKNILERDTSKTYTVVSNSTTNLTSFTNIFRGLLSEQVSIQKSGVIRQTTNKLYTNNFNLLNITETIRSLHEFKPKLAGNNGDYMLLKLGKGFELEIERSIYRKKTGAVLAMEPERCQKVLTCFRNNIEHHKSAILVENLEIRPFVRKLIELEFPDVPVLSQQELLSEIEYTFGNKIELEQNVPPEYIFSRNNGSLQHSIPKEETLHENEQKENLATEIIEPERTTIQVYVTSDFFDNPTSIQKEPIEDLFDLMWEGLFYELGIILPNVHYEIDKNLNQNEFRFQLNDQSFGPYEGLRSNEFLVNDTVDRLTLLRVSGRKAINPANGSEVAIIENNSGEVDLVKQAGLTTWEGSGYLVLVLSSEIKKNASVFLTPFTLQYILASISSSFVDLVETFKKQFTEKKYQLILKNLLDEEISIRDQRSILESLLSINGTNDVDLNRFILFTPYTDGICPDEHATDLKKLSIDKYADYVRTSLKRYISHKYTNGSNTLIVYLLDREIEGEIIQASRISAIDEMTVQQIKNAISNEVTNLPPTSQKLVILTTFEVRRKLWNLIHNNFPHLAVLSYQELSPTLNIQPIARISLKD